MLEKQVFDWNNTQGCNASKVVEGANPDLRMEKCDWVNLLSTGEWINFAWEGKRPDLGALPLPLQCQGSDYTSLTNNKNYSLV